MREPSSRGVKLGRSFPRKLAKLTFRKGDDRLRILKESNWNLMGRRCGIVILKSYRAVDRQMQHLTLKRMMIYLW